MKHRVRYNLSRLFLPTLVLFLLAAVIRGMARVSRPFADFFNLRIGAFFRFVTAKMTGWFHFSFAELLLLLSPVLLFLLIFFGVRAAKTKKATLRYISRVLCLPMAVYILFVSTYAVGYQATPLTDKIGLPDVTVTRENLLRVSEIVTKEAAALSPLFPVDEKTGATLMPYSWEKMTEKLNESYKKLSESYPFLQSHRTTLKRILLSDPMTYTGIVGVYTFFTGESNVNVTYPDYSTVYTAAHEMAHQRGIAPENEANFIAFLSCITSEDDYLRYVGYRNMADYIGNAIYKTDKNSYPQHFAYYTAGMHAEDRAYRTIYEAHRNETVRDVASNVNDTYLQMQGTAGRITYSLVVTLAVAYYA